ncbi:hypothetical protein N0V82_007657 [Gnomoniopsis sp. IMI 355080]|nr:hypothetical protein N0V82_007657 [Gnomoniopsis sp. IMI 355080]
MCHPQSYQSFTQLFKDTSFTQQTLIMSGNKALSARETELAVLAWRALEDPSPKFDYQKLADVADFKNPNSARATFSSLRKKLLEGGYATSPSSNSNATPKGKRNAAAAGEDGDDNPTPTKKPRGRPAKKAAAAAPASIKDEKEEQAESADDKI